VLAGLTPDDQQALACLPEKLIRSQGEAA